MSKTSILDKLNEGWFDLTHLEINTIIKSSMTGAKASSRPRILLEQIAEDYHDSLIRMGIKYEKHLPNAGDDTSTQALFRSKENIVFVGSGIKAFREISKQAFKSVKWLSKHKELAGIDPDHIQEDAMILERIRVNTDDIANLLARHKKVKEDNNQEDYTHLFDVKKEFRKRGADPDKNDFYNYEFLCLSKERAHKYELSLTLDELTNLKKIFDIGDEKIVTQTIVGIDGDVTTRISKNFAKDPNSFVHKLHNESVTLSVKYWTSLVEIFGSLIAKIVGGSKE